MVGAFHHFFLVPEKSEASWFQTVGFQAPLENMRASKVSWLVLTHKPTKTQ